MTLSRRLVAVGYALYGVLMLIGGTKAYTSPSYTVLFDLAHDVSPHGTPATTVWGVGFLVVGLCGLLVKPWRDHDPSLVAMIVLLSSWSLGLWTAVWPRRVASTWGGPIWPTLVSMLLLVNAGRSVTR